MEAFLGGAEAMKFRAAFHEPVLWPSRAGSAAGLQTSTMPEMDRNCETCQICRSKISEFRRRRGSAGVGTCSASPFDSVVPALAFIDTLAGEIRGRFGDSATGGLSRFESATIDFEWGATGQAAAKGAARP